MIQTMIMKVVLLNLLEWIKYLMLLTIQIMHHIKKLKDQTVQNQLF